MNPEAGPEPDGLETWIITEGNTLWKRDTHGGPLLRIPCQQPPPHEHGKRGPYDDRQ